MINYSKNKNKNDDFKAVIAHVPPESYHSKKIMIKNKYYTMQVKYIIIVLQDFLKELGVSTKEEKQWLPRKVAKAMLFVFIIKNIIKNMVISKINVQ